jgi:hypothetical protein
MACATCTLKWGSRPLWQAQVSATPAASRIIHPHSPRTSSTQCISVRVNEMEEEEKSVMMGTEIAPPLFLCCSH